MRSDECPGLSEGDSGPVGRDPGYNQVAQGVLTVQSTAGTLCFTLRAQPRVAFSAKPVSESLESRLDA